MTTCCFVLLALSILCSHGHSQLSHPTCNRITAKDLPAESLTQATLLTLGRDAVGSAPRQHHQPWSLESVARLFGSLSLHSTGARHQTMTVASYLAASNEEVGFEQLFSPSTGVAYLVDSVLEEVQTRLPSSVATIQHRKIISVGRNGTGSLLHQHDASWLFLASGTKEWLLLPASTKGLDEAMKSDPCTLRNEFRDLPWTVCRQHAGEIVYLPRATWHATCNLHDVETQHIARKATVTVGAGAQGLEQKSHRLLYAARDGNVSEVTKICADASLRMTDPALPSTSNEASKSQSEENDNAMHVAASHDRVAVIERLLSPQCGNSWMMHAAGTSQDLPVHRAARYGSMGVLKSMLEHEPGLANAASQRLRRTPLHMAAYYGHVASIDILLSSGADIHAKLSSGDSAVHRAAEGSQVEALEALIERRANPAALDNRGLPAVQAAATKGHVSIMLYLLRLSPPAGHEQRLLLSHASLEERLTWKAAIRIALSDATTPLGLASAISGGDDARANISTEEESDKEL